MNPSEDILPALEEDGVKRSRLFPLLPWFIIAFVALLALELYLDILSRAYPSRFGLLVFAVIDGIPFTAAVLLWFKHKAGWIVACYYFMFTSLSLGAAFVQVFFVRRDFSPTHSSLCGLFALAISIIVLVWVLLHDIRRFLHIKQKMFWTVLSTALVLAVGLTVLFRRM